MVSRVVPSEALMTTQGESILTTEEEGILDRSGGGEPVIPKRGIQSTLARANVSVRAVPDTITQSILNGEWDDFSDTNFKSPTYLYLFFLEMVGGFGFSIQFFLYSLPFTDYPLFTDKSKTFWDRLAVVILVQFSMVLLFSLFVFYEKSEYTMQNFRWWILRFHLSFIVLWMVLWESLKETTFGIDVKKDGNVQNQKGISMVEFIQSSFMLWVGSIVSPWLENIGRAVGIVNWKNPIAVLRGLDKNGNPIPHLYSIGRRSLLVSFYFMFSYLLGILWVLFDIVFLRKQKGLLWTLLRPLMFALLKRNLWVCGNFLSQNSGLLLPQFRHYIPCGVHGIVGLYQVIYLGASARWVDFMLYMIVDWVSFSGRLWTFTDYGDDNSWFRSIKERIRRQRMSNVGKQERIIVHGWSILCENLWQTIGFFTMLYLYPISLYLNNVEKTPIYKEQTIVNTNTNNNYSNNNSNNSYSSMVRDTPNVNNNTTTNNMVLISEEKSILTYAFFRTTENCVFIALGGFSDFIQDGIAHHIVVKLTKCTYTRHLGIRNWNGHLFFLISGWQTSFCIFPLMVALKIARYTDVIEGN